MTIEQAIARLIVMMEKGQTENNKALGMAIRALEDKREVRNERMDTSK